MELRVLLLLCGAARLMGEDDHPQIPLLRNVRRVHSRPLPRRDETKTGETVPLHSVTMIMTVTITDT